MSILSHPQKFYGQLWGNPLKPFHCFPNGSQLIGFVFSLWFSYFNRLMRFFCNVTSSLIRAQKVTFSLISQYIKSILMRKKKQNLSMEKTSQNFHIVQTAKIIFIASDSISRFLLIIALSRMMETFSIM